MIGERRGEMIDEREGEMIGERRGEMIGENGGDCAVDWATTVTLSAVCARLLSPSSTHTVRVYSPTVALLPADKTPPALTAKPLTTGSNE